MCIATVRYFELLVTQPILHTVFIFLVFYRRQLTWLIKFTVAIHLLENRLFVRKVSVFNQFCEYFVVSNFFYALLDRFLSAHIDFIYYFYSLGVVVALCHGLVNSMEHFFEGGGSTVVILDTRIRHSGLVFWTRKITDISFRKLFY